MFKINGILLKRIVDMVKKVKKKPYNQKVKSIKLYNNVSFLN